MKLVTFENAARQSRMGALAGNHQIVDLHTACALYLRDVENEAIFYRMADALVPPDMRALFRGGDTSLEAAHKALDYVAHLGASGVDVTGPRGETLIYSLRRHSAQGAHHSEEIFSHGGQFSRAPRRSDQGGFFASGHAVDRFLSEHRRDHRPDEPVIYPEHLTQELDYELELAVVLKKAGKHFTPEEAPSYIGGYVIFNDITARDIQRREMKSGVFSFCKGIDTFCPLGPWIVTADEIPDAHNLAMELRVNGESRQRSHSSKMSVKIPEILSHYSPMGYSAGDVVSTGTVSGVAAFSGDPKAWYLKPGDVMECEIEKIGVLRNPVISWEKAYGQKPAALATQET